MSIEHARPTHVDGVSPRGERLLTWPQLALLIPYSRQHVGRLEARGVFPRRLQIGAARVAWRESEVLAWLDERARRPPALAGWPAAHRDLGSSGGLMRPPMMPAALGYARRGLPVFPLNGKVPLVSKAAGGSGVYDATTDPDRIADWWARFPGANIGVPTGAPSGFWVLDCDPNRGGGESLAAPEAAHGPLPVTPEQITGGDGRHLLFGYHGEAIRNRAGKLGPGLDVRATGGYIVAAPSVHPDTGRRYRWRPDRHPRDLQPALAPPWLLDLVVDRPAPAAARRGMPIGTSADGGGYAAAALRREAEAVCTAPVGSRNDALNAAAFSLGQLVGGGALDRGRVEAALAAAAAAAGLPPDEVAGTLRSGLGAGMGEPRGVPARPARPGFIGRRAWLADIRIPVTAAKAGAGARRTAA